MWELPLPFNWLQGSSELAGLFLGWWSLPSPWVAQVCSCLHPSWLFPFSLVTPTLWWACPGPSTRASEP